VQPVRLRFEQPFDLVSSLHLHRFGPRDPTFRLGPTEAVRARHTPDGLGAIRVRRVDPFTFDVEVWGSGGPFLRDRAAAWLGAHDAPETFQPEHPRLRRLGGRLRGFRLPRAPTVFEVLVIVVLQQRVSWREAARSFRRIVGRYGARFDLGDGPSLLVMPPAEVWRRLSLEAYRAFDVDGQRARTLKAVATSVRRLEEIAAMPIGDAEARLRAFPGVGPWTAHYVLGLALGHADAVPLDDYDLPRLVSSALAGEPRGDDARMLELLEPYRGHRFRVIRWLQESGLPTPRFGPRRPGSSFRRRP
jgi:3-methyladenine DNA glycosylase/8-oxoguanine DNA glycosylase